MSAAFDAFTDYFDDTSSGTNLGNHTTSGSNRVLVGIAAYDPTQTSITGMTYGGAALTKLNSITNSTRGIDLWYLIGPASGSNMVAYTAAAVAVHTIAVASFTGANAVDTFTSAAGAGNSITVVSATGNMIMGGTFVSATTGPFTPKAGVTDIHNNATFKWSGYMSGAASALFGCDNRGSTPIIAACNIAAGTQAAPNFATKRLLVGVGK